MNRDQIKYVAMFTMLLNHIANVFLEPGTFLFEVMVDVGYFTAITMCYFLVEATATPAPKRNTANGFCCLPDFRNPLLSCIYRRRNHQFRKHEHAIHSFPVLPDSLCNGKNPFRNPADTLHLGPGICLRLQRLGLSCPYLHLLVRKLWPPGCTGENAASRRPEC